MRIKEKKETKEYMDGYKKATEEKYAEVARIRLENKNEKDRIIKNNKDEVEGIRESMRKEYEPRLIERDKEILRLNTIIQNNKKRYSQLKTDEIDAKFQLQEIIDTILAGTKFGHRMEQCMLLAKHKLKEIGTIDIGQIEKINKGGE